MIEAIWNWVLGQWLELSSLGIATAALIYAALAYHSSKAASKEARASDLASLRIQAKSALSDAERSQLNLRRNCKSIRGEWEKHEGGHFPLLGRKPLPELASNARVERQGEMLLAEVRNHFSQVAELNADQLEQGIQRANLAALRIEALAENLERPRSFFD